MIIYERYNNVESPTDWAQRVLTPQELVQFNNAFDLNTKLWISYEDAGLIENNTIRYKVYSYTYNRDIDILIGEQLVDSGQGNLTVAPEYTPWLNRYLADVGAPVVKTAIHS